MTDSRRTYTEEFKIEVVRLLESSGKSQSDVAEELGVPPTNIHRWKKK